MRPARAWARVRLPLLLLTTLLLAGCGAPDPYDRAPDEVTEREMELVPRSFFMAQLEATRAAHARGSVEVLEGGPVDAWLLVGIQCANFQQGAFQAIREAPTTRNATFEAEVQKGLVCLPFDNDDAPYGEAAPEGTVRVRYRLALWY